MVPLNCRRYTILSFEKFSRTFSNICERVLKLVWKSLNSRVELFEFSFRIMKNLLVGDVSHIDHHAFFVFEVDLVAEEGDYPLWPSHIVNLSLIIG